MKTVAIVQARMGSTRFPGKVMKPILGRPMIELLLERLRLAEEIDAIILATTTGPENLPLEAHVLGLGIDVFKGSEDDVLDRYYKAAKTCAPDIVIRITGDCPLIDPALVNKAVRLFKGKNVDYLGNKYPPTYPDGLDTEVFTFPALQRAARESSTAYDREHVTPFIVNSGNFSLYCMRHTENFSGERWTVDEPDDYRVVKNIFEHFAPRIDFGWEEILELSRQKPRLFEANRHFIRDEGAQIGTGQKLWKRARRVIPGGNMLLSKRAEMFAPGQWPAYFKKAKGCRVWDLDGKEYIDMNFMGIGTNILGYGHPEVDAAVQTAVRQGNMSTLNSPEEVYLAERLIELHPWADMVRFARTGGEANAVAVRIARAAAGKTKIAICGYHGWHDWYLAANLGGGSSLNEHLLPGLKTHGIPENLKETVFPFSYNRFDQLEQIVARHDIGVIKMEVSRNQKPQNHFLEKIRKLATDNQIILIFDECTSGFRQSFGGLHKLYHVEPDMAVFGKALGNGYAITAVIGRKKIMEAAQTTFISSTFWTERIGPAAALKTLEIMEREKSWETITRTGKTVSAAWLDLAQKYEIPIDLSGLPAMPGFTFKSDDHLAFKTLITQEMLARGYLAGTSFYACTEHTPEIVASYIDALDPIFKQIRECMDGQDVHKLLKGPVCHSKFKRLA